MKFEEYAAQSRREFRNALIFVVVFSIGAPVAVIAFLCWLGSK